MEPQNQLAEQENTISDELNSFIQYEKASQGQRFLNFLIDNLFMRFALGYATGIVVGFFISNLFPEFALRILYDRETFDLLPLAYIIGIVNYLVYYTFCEKVFHGYTLGKLVT